MARIPPRSRSTRRLPLVALAALLCLVASASLPLDAGPVSSHHKISPDLRSLRHTGAPQDVARVIVQMEGPSVGHGRSKVRDLGGEPGKSLHVIDGFVATLSHDGIADLAADSRVRRISPDRKVRPFMEVAGPASGAPQFDPPRGLTGAGITVAVIDSGIYAHEDLPGLAGYVDFIQPNAPFSRDPYGHGTHVAGIIAGQHHSDPSGSGLTFGGLAPEATLISLRVLDRNGEGYVSDVIEAISWAVANRETHEIRILNVSLGHPVAEPAAFDPLAQACEQAWRAGLLVVTSAGNLGVHGNGTVTSPGNDALVLTVGAADDGDTTDPLDDGIAPFSSRGPSLFDLVLKPDLVAPGHLIVSLRSPHSSLDVQHPEVRVSLDGGPRGVAREPRYFEMSGSSMAAASVSAAAALLLQADPSLSPDTVKARLMAAARRTASDSVFGRGTGVLDVEAGLAHEGVALLAVSPLVREEGGEVLVLHAVDLWGAGAGWDLESLYGDPDLWNTEEIWQNGFLDDPCATGEGVIWQGLKGEGVIWQGVASELACTSGAGVIWQGGLIRQGDEVSQEGVIWQGGSRK
jgi:serine protease AprX